MARKIYPRQGLGVGCRGFLVEVRGMEDIDVIFAKQWGNARHANEFGIDPIGYAIFSF